MCRIFTCFHSQVSQTLVKNLTWSNLRLAALWHLWWRWWVLQWRVPRLFKWYLWRSGVLLSLVPACQCPGRHGGHGGRDWEVGCKVWRGKIWHQVQVCGVASFTRAGGSSKDFHDRPSLIYIVSFPNLTSSRFKPVQVIFPIWLSTWFCDFARWCSSTWRAYWWLCLWWRCWCWDSVATSCRSCLHLARLSPGFLYPKSYSPMLLWLLLLSLLSGEVLEKSW